MRVERRLARRFQIENATVRYRVDKWFARFKSFEGPVPTVNISKGGLSFLTKRKIKQGTKVTVILSVPDWPQKLVLKGTVRYCIIMPLRGEQLPFRVGIAFKRFGRSPWSNPIETLEELRKLEAVYMGRQPSEKQQASSPDRKMPT